ncbi:MAG: hypothetical protein CMJ77_13100 [Planctomycetaceae bacterium]|nr:hypothetical protein [Planctomycetaceae bacterium]
MGTDSMRTLDLTGSVDSLVSRSSAPRSSIICLNEYRLDDALQGWHVPPRTLANDAFRKAFVPRGRERRTK